MSYILRRLNPGRGRGNFIDIHTYPTCLELRDGRSHSFVGVLFCALLRLGWSFWGWGGDVIRLLFGLVIDGIQEDVHRRS